MLVLSRKLNQKIQIGADVTVMVVRIQNGKVRLGISAPATVRVERAEVARTRQPRLAGSGSSAAVPDQTERRS